MANQSMDPDFDPQAELPPNAFAVNESNFDFSKLKPQEHNLIQRGNFIECTMPGHKHGHRLPAGKILTKKDGRYILEEMTILKTDKKGKVTGQA